MLALWYLTMLSAIPGAHDMVAAWNDAIAQTLRAATGASEISPRPVSASKPH